MTWRSSRYRALIADPPGPTRAGAERPSATEHGVQHRGRRAPTAIPERDDLAQLRAREKPRNLRQSVRLRAEEVFVPSACVTAFGRVAQREAGNARRRLLLHAARIGGDEGGLGLETEEVEIAERRRDVDARVAKALLAATCLEPSVGARVHRKTTGDWLASATRPSTTASMRPASSTSAGRCNVTDP